jgi:hypothetical protein
MFFENIAYSSIPPTPQEYEMIDNGDLTVIVLSNPPSIVEADGSLRLLDKTIDPTPEAPYHNYL